MKKVSILLLIVLALFSFSACDNSTDVPKVNVPSWADGTYSVGMAMGEYVSNLGTLTIGNGDFSMTVGEGETALQVTSANITVDEQKDTVNAEGQKEYRLSGTITFDGESRTASFVFTKISDTQLSLNANLGGTVMPLICEKQ